MIHGGDLTEAIARFGRPREDWLDLSTGISPFTYGFSPPAPAQYRTLPAQADIDALVAAARSAYAVPEATGLVAAPGTQALIQWLPHVAPPGPVAVLGPTYGPHAATWRAIGRDVTEIADLDALPETARILVVTNPNNPDGRILLHDRLFNVAETLADRGGWLVLDEAFADVDPDVSIIPSLAAHPNILVLRSFGKFFGLAGLRLGFAVGATEIVDDLASCLGEWAVSAPALSVGRQALADDAWQASARIRIAAAAADLEGVFERHRLPVIGRAGLFVLVRCDAATDLHEHLAGAGIWCRRFDYASDWLRFGLPPDIAACSRLDRALGEFTAIDSAPGTRDQKEPAA